MPQFLTYLRHACFALGLVLLWWLTPVGPREGWQIPRDQFVCGPLDGGPWLVTVPRSPKGDRIMGTPETGPVRVWDYRSGTLVTERFTRQDSFDRVLTHGTKHLWLQVGPSGPKRDQFLLRLYDPIRGTDVAEFRCRVPRHNVWWIASPDGQTCAYITYDEDETPWLRVHDTASGKLLHAIKDVVEPIRFSKDGRYLASTARQWNAKQQMLPVDGQHAPVIHVWEVASGARVCDLSAPRDNSDVSFPKEFSADGSLLLDSRCRVWDLAARKVRFQVPKVYYGSSLFSPDGRHLIVVKGTETEVHLAFIDTTTGTEIVEKRLPLVSGDRPTMHLGEATPDRRLLLAHGTPRFTKPHLVFQWLSRIPGLARLGGEQPEDAFVLVETATGRVVMRGGSSAWSCTPDGELLIARTRDEVYSLWNIPPRKPYRLLTLVSLLWTLLFALLALRAKRRQAKSASSLQVENQPT